MIYDVEDTIVAIASAAGGAARGIVRLSGPAAIDLTQSFFQPDEVGLAEQRWTTCRFGSWALPFGATLPVTLYVWPTSQSYTRQPTVELHTLGCRPLLNCMLEQLCQSGARLAQPGEFTLRAFLAGRLDLPQAEAVLGVIDASDQRQLAIALDQLAGGLSRDLQPLRDRLLNLCADVEAGLDFVDEDIEFVSHAEIELSLREVETGMCHLLARMGQRDRVDFQPRVVLRGRPNVGKSTLWNALLRRDAAIVSEIPGTTRDYLEATISVGGEACRLIDAAGVDASLNSAIDQAAQSLAGHVSRQADMIVLCLDASRPIEPWEWNEIRQASATDVVVLNKVDRERGEFWHSLPRRAQVEQFPGFIRLHLPADVSSQNPTCRELVKLSALTGSGIAELEARLSHGLQQRSTEESGLMGATATRCRASLRQACQAVHQARQIASSHYGQELLAAEIREALDHLGQILGTIYTEDILDRVFQRFCIGK